jgi:nitrogen regulatory protein PII 1
MEFIMVRAIIRQEKSSDVLAALMDAGFPAATKIGVFGRGKQRGIRMGEIVYDELPKDQLLLVLPAEDKDIVVKTIMDVARSSSGGAYGDGKIFVSGVDEIYTISTGKKEV